jgi:hypothetical protein
MQSGRADQRNGFGSGLRAAQGGREGGNKRWKFQGRYLNDKGSKKRSYFFEKK